MTITKILTNVCLVAVVAILLTGCALLPGKAKTDSDSMYKSGAVTGDDATFTEVSEDNSLETVESELEATVIEDEDLSDIEADLDLEVEIQ